MKRFSVLTLFVALAVTVSARQVDVNTMRQIAAFYFSQVTGAKAPAADDLDLALQVDNPTLCLPAVYVFNMPGGGWVVASASDCVEPILAYSPDGKIDPDRLGENMQLLLGRYGKVVSTNQLNENIAAKNASVSRKWQELLDETFVGAPEKSSVLIQTKWGQGDADEPSYNCMCPIDPATGKHSITGCVAVAMAQIIRYWEYPVQGGTPNNMTASVMWNGQRVTYEFARDSNRFDYANMPNKVKYTTAWEQRHAVGKLMFAVGVVAKMNWSSSSSSASSANAFTGYTRYFAYAPECQFSSHDDMGDEAWVAMLRSETRDHARPVYISARTAPDPNDNDETHGHAFIACGVSGSDSNKIYLNLGWDGSENGFFCMNPVSDMAETGGYLFNEGMAGIHHLHPNTEGIDQNTNYTAAPVYPNPASSYLMVPAGLRLNATLTVYDLEGKMVDKVIVPGGVQEYRLDISRYPVGTYLYRLNGAAVKFIKQ